MKDIGLGKIAAGNMGQHVFAICIRRLIRTDILSRGCRVEFNNRFLAGEGETCCVDIREDRQADIETQFLERGRAVRKCGPGSDRIAVSATVNR